jgi:phosphatidylinositol glycan class N
MTIIGILYLSFEDFVLADFSPINGRPSTKLTHPYGRIVTGVQIGLTVLSMVVTRSSALSIQAKQGLPFGNQIVGWTVLGK